MPVYDPIHSETFYTKQDVDRLVRSASAFSGASWTPDVRYIAISDWVADGDLWKAVVQHSRPSKFYGVQIVNTVTEKTFQYEDDSRATVGEWTVWLSFLPDFQTAVIII